MIVMKFGGTSLGSAERIKNVAAIIETRLEKKPIIVCSAVSGITNKLIDLGRKSLAGQSYDTSEVKKIHSDILKDLDLEASLLDALLGELNAALGKKISEKEFMDSIQSFGERLSVRIVAAHMKTKAYDAFDVGMITDSEFGKAEPLDSSYEKIATSLANLDHIPIVTGFIGKNEAGQISTLSRGGSDYTASIIGAAVHAEEIQIWTDVNGIMSADPKIVPDAITVKQMSFNEASELAFFGAKVLHPKSLIPAINHHIPVRVLNTHNPEHDGTLILAETESNGIKAVACRKNVSLVHLSSTRMLNAHGYLAKIFDVFAKNKKSVDMVTTSEVSVSMTIDEPEGMDSIVKELEGIAHVSIEDNKSIICIVGEGMAYGDGLSGKVFSSIGNANIPVKMICQGASKINISFIVDDEDTEKAVKILHSTFIR
ncbi:aspartate kinase [Candidatus Woesearchaeota archaeon]|nr:aspartate kinase [Candidatus Woesearchaeota archaeon]